jgi:antitoxin component YwqK of YwqJK toxin-antitoxin module
MGLIKNRWFVLAISYWLLAIGLPFKSIAQDTKDGFNKLYYPNGKLSSDGTIRNGKPDGYWKNYYENGKLKSEGNRKDFKLDSLWKFYTEKGLLYLIYTYKEGKKTGFKYTYKPQLKDSSKGMLASKENYSGDTLQGNAYYYDKGKLHQIIYFKDGLAEGKSLQFNKDSLITEIIIYKGGFIKKITKINQVNTEGNKEGLWQTFYADTNYKHLTGESELQVNWEGTYVDGKRDGYFKTYDRKGKLLTVEKYINDVQQLDAPELAKLDIKTTYFSNGVVESTGPYKDNQPFGIHKIYDETGKVKRADIYDSGRVVASGAINDGDQQEGDWKEFYENGDLKDEGKYENGIKVGDWKYLFHDGKKFETGKYDKKGKQTGTWLWYFEDGNLRRSSSFSRGQEDGDFAEYNDSGKIITRGEYADGLKEGKWVYQLGNFKSVGKYSGDLEDSTWTEYYNDNGKVRFTGKYSQGRPDGVHMWYYPDGKTELEGHYNLGLMEDRWKYYSEDGSLFLTITYRDDVEIKYDAVAAP